MARLYVTDLMTTELTDTLYVLRTKHRLWTTVYVSPTVEDIRTISLASDDIIERQHVF